MDCLNPFLPITPNQSCCAECGGKIRVSSEVVSTSPVTTKPTPAEDIREQRISQAVAALTDLTDEEVLNGIFDEAKIVQLPRANDEDRQAVAC